MNPDVRPTDSQRPPTLPQVSAKGAFCEHCGYALSGPPTDGKCPQCAKSCTTLDIRSSPKVPAGFLCYKCSYPLTGLDADGTCPECSTAYSLSLAFRGRPHPGQMSLSLRIIWPVALGAFSIVSALILDLGRGTGRSMSDIFGCTAFLCAAINLINILVISGTLSSRYVPPHRRRNWMHNMFFLGRWVGVAWVLAVIVGVLSIGAPILAILMAMAY